MVSAIRFPSIVPGVYRGLSSYDCFEHPLTEPEVKLTGSFMSSQSPSKGIFLWKSWA